MKVYLKKEDKNTMIPGIIVTIVFLSFSIGVFVAVITSGGSFIDILSSFGSLLLFAIVFFGFGVYFIYALFSKPKRYRVKLTKKKVETYKGKQITYMVFNTEKETEQEDEFVSSVYKCYTKEENNLIVGNDYVLGIKEFNWEPKYVAEYDKLDEIEKTKVSKKGPTVSMSPVFLSVGFIFGGFILLCILGIIFFPEYILVYLSFGTFSAVALFMAFKGIKTWKIDNNIEQNEEYFNQEIEKIEPKNIVQEKV